MGMSTGGSSGTLNSEPVRGIVTVNASADPSYLQWFPAANLDIEMACDGVLGGVEHYAIEGVRSGATHADDLDRDDFLFLLRQAVVAAELDHFWSVYLMEERHASSVIPTGTKWSGGIPMRKR